MRPEELRRWHESWYAPNNATLVVVGDVQAATVFEQAKHFFASLPKKELPIPKQQIGISEGERRGKIHLSLAAAKLHMGFQAPHMKTAQEPWEPYALWVAANLLNGGSSSRLQKELIRGQGIAASVYASYDPFQRQNSLFTLGGTPSTGISLEMLEQALLKQIQKLQLEAIPAEELKRIKMQVVAQHVFSKESLFDKAYDLGLMESLGLSWQTAEEFVDNIQAVTEAQVQSVIKKYLIPNSLTVLYALPQETSNTVVNTTHDKIAKE
jgi:zinc protease